MINSFNINELYHKVFGVTGSRFNVDKNSNIAGNYYNTAKKAGSFAVGQLAQGAVNNVLNVNGQQFDFNGIETIPFPDVVAAKSVLGTPIYEQINLSYVDEKSKKTIIDYTFPGWPLVSFSGGNEIIKTFIKGKPGGTVKEFIYEDDYSVTIRGFLINEQEQSFPEADFQELAQICKCRLPLTVTSQVFNLLDIHALIIERYRFPEVEGYPNMQPFELECLSDAPAILEIKSVKTRKPINKGK